MSKDLFKIYFWCFGFWVKEEILLTYYRDFYLYKNYITIVDINRINEMVACGCMLIYNSGIFKFGDVIELS